jgi:hypothetical protein
MVRYLTGGKIVNISDTPASVADTNFVTVDGFDFAQIENSILLLDCNLYVNVPGGASGMQAQLNITGTYSTLGYSIYIFDVVNGALTASAVVDNSVPAPVLVLPGVVSTYNVLVKGYFAVDTLSPGRVELQIAQAVLDAGNPIDTAFRVSYAEYSFL